MGTVKHPKSKRVKKRCVNLRLDEAFLVALDDYCRRKRLSRQGVIRKALIGVVGRKPLIRGQHMYRPAS